MKTNLYVAFRVDASHDIGIGHVIRCLTLADMLKENGASTRFVCRYLPESLRELIHSKNHEVVILDSNPGNVGLDELAHAHFLGTSQSQDADETLRVLSDLSWDWLIVDHYAIDIRFESKLRKVVKNILAVDDIADRQHDCDVLLDQNLYSDMDSRYIDKVPKSCQLLLGPQYALLRDEFRQLRKQVGPRDGLVKRILVFFGGIDPTNFTGSTLEAIKNLGVNNLSIDVVIGAEHPYRLDIEHTCREMGYSCYIQTSRMAEIMAAADLALGAGGSTSWERCCLGVATISVAFAENQYDIAKALDEAGACIFLGDQLSAVQSKIESTLKNLLRESNLISEMSMKAFSLVDGRGTERVCESIWCST